MSRKPRKVGVVPPKIRGVTRGYSQVEFDCHDCLCAFTVWYPWSYPVTDLNKLSVSCPLCRQAFGEGRAFESEQNQAMGSGGGIEGDVVPPKTISVPEAGRRYFGLAKNASYQAAKIGQIPTIRIGGRIRVPVSQLEILLTK